LYIKELSVLDLSAPAQAVLSEGSDVIMASASYGKGRVFALGDPWLYNEYVDGKKLPADFDNFNAARDLAGWLLQSPEKETPDTRAVAQAVENLRKAMVTGDAAALDKIADEHLSYGHSGGKVEDKAAFIAQLTSGRSDFTDISLSEQSISVVGNTAVVRHNLSANTNDLGKGPGEVHLAVMLVWVKQKGTWKLLARQAVKKN
jgi:ketosteroid isomerase-like protein